MHIELPRDRSGSPGPIGPRLRPRRARVFPMAALLRASGAPRRSLAITPSRRMGRARAVA